MNTKGRVFWIIGPLVWHFGIMIRDPIPLRVQGLKQLWFRAQDTTVSMLFGS